MRIKYLEMMLFILVSGATPSISVSSLAPNRALSRSTLLCNLSISTSYWKRRDVALLVTRHTLAGSSVRRQVRETERQRDKKRTHGGGGGGNSSGGSFSRDKRGFCKKRNLLFTQRSHYYVYICTYVVTMNQKRIISSSLIW